MENGSRKRSHSHKKSKKAVTIISCLLVAGIAGFAACSLAVKDVVKDWEEKIYPGVMVDQIDLGGMTKDEAKDKLAETFQTSIVNKKLSIEIDGKEFELTYGDINPSYDIDNIVDNAYSFGKEHNVLQKYISIRNKGKNEIPLDFSYDENELNKFEENLINEVTKSPQDAKININGSSISVEPEVNGVTIDASQLDSKLKEAINGDINSNDKISIDADVTKAKITSEDLEKIKGAMGTFSTSYGTSAAGRSHNIEIATKSINGTIVMPGETFSFNDVVGARTEERGFKEAGTYVGNKVEPGIGGGICQVSTTLYRAVMRANIRSTERTNHSMAVGYASPGLDATVAYGYLDYKFTNPYDFPIYIQGYTGGKVVTYTVYGDPSALQGKTYDMTNEILETIPAQSNVVLDNTLLEGQEVNEGGGMTGYRTVAYQVTYENGVEVNREIVSRDTYAKVDNVVKKGTKVAAPVETPAETPAAQDGAAQSQGTTEQTQTVDPAQATQ